MVTTAISELVFSCSRNWIGDCIGGDVFGIGLVLAFRNVSQGKGTRQQATMAVGPSAWHLLGGLHDDLAQGSRYSIGEPGFAPTP